MQTSAIGSSVPLSPTNLKPSTGTTIESTSSHLSSNYNNVSSTLEPNNFTKLNWSNHSSDLVQSINSSINQYTDLIISIEGQKQLWNVHKIIFVSGCELIRKLLMEGDGEHSFSANQNVDSLILTSITPTQLNNLIDYLYNGELKLPKDEIPAFLNLCNYFGVKGVEQRALGQMEEEETQENVGASESILGKALLMETKTEKKKDEELDNTEGMNEEGSDSCAPGDDDDLNGSDEDTSFSSSIKQNDQTNNSSSFPLDLTNFLNQLQHSNHQTSRSEVAGEIGSDHEDDNNEPLLLGQILRNNIESQLMMINGNNGVDKTKGKSTAGRANEISNASPTSQLMSTLFQLAQHQQPNAALPHIPPFSSSALTPTPSNNNIGSRSSSPQPQHLSRVRATDPRPCPKCNKIYRSAHTLRTHLEDKHTTCPGYRCVLCGTVAKSRNSLHSHMSRQHRGISTKDLPVLPMPAPFDPILANQLLNNGGKGQWGSNNVDLNETDGQNPPASLQHSQPHKSGRKHSNNMQHFNDPLYPTPHQMNSGTTGSALLDTYLQFIAENSSSLCVAAAAVAAAVEANSTAPQLSNENNTHNVSVNADTPPPRSNRRNHKRKIDDDGSLG